VQIIQGRIAHPARLREMADVVAQSLTASRPDVIGATIGVAPDGQFTQTVAFASEAAARAGEGSELSPAAEELMSELQDLTFIDLRSPWFETH